MPRRQEQAGLRLRDPRRGEALLDRAPQAPQPRHLQGRRGQVHCEERELERLGRVRGAGPSSARREGRRGVQLLLRRRVEDRRTRRRASATRLAATTPTRRSTTTDRRRTAATTRSRSRRRGRRPRASGRPTPSRSTAPATFRLCFRIRAGDYNAPKADDCILGEVCTDADYKEANVEQTLPELRDLGGQGQRLREEVGVRARRRT